MLFRVENQKLTAADLSGIIGKTVKFLTAEFEFSDDWNGWTKTAYFEQGGTTKTYLLVDDAVPATGNLNLDNGMCSVYVSATKDGARRNTSVAIFTVISTGSLVGTVPADTPLTVIEQMTEWLTVLDNSGDGTKYLADDGTYKEVSGGSGDIDLSGYATVKSVEEHTGDTKVHVTETEKEEWSRKSNFSGNYAELSGRPEIPSVTNDLTNELKRNYDEAYEHAKSGHAPSDAEKNVQADWNQADNTKDNFIKNKPEIPSTEGFMTESDVQAMMEAGADGFAEYLNIAIAGKADRILKSVESVNSKEIQPNILYVWGEVSSLTITLATPEDADRANEYMFEFVSGATATTLVLPADIKWIGSSTVDANTTYQCSILNGIAVMGGA